MRQVPSNLPPSSRVARAAGLAALAALMVVTGILQACQAPQGETFIRRPLRSVETERDRLTLACIRNDPFFNSEECRELR
ncbi:MAG: hypothetical protein AAF501_21575 [Pseudomonadota bacterium]